MEVRSGYPPGRSIPFSLAVFCQNPVPVFSRVGHGDAISVNGSESGIVQGLPENFGIGQGADVHRSVLPDSGTLLRIVPEGQAASFLDAVDHLLKRSDAQIAFIGSKCWKALVIRCLRQVEGQKFPVVVVNREIAAEPGSGPVVEGGEDGSGHKDHVRVQPGEAVYFIKINLGPVGHDRRVFFAVFQKIPEGANAVGELDPVVVIEEEDPEPPEAGYRNQVFRAVSPVAEAGPQVHEPRKRNILPGWRGRPGARQERKNQDQDRKGPDPFE